MLFGASLWDQNVSLPATFLMFYSSILEIPNVDIPIYDMLWKKNMEDLMV